MNEPIGCALCGGNDHNADECKRFAGERERAEFEAAVEVVNERGWASSTDLARQIWQLVRAAQPAPVVPEVSGIGRDVDHPRALVLYLRTEPTDDDIRAIQQVLRTSAEAIAAAPAQGQQVECQECERLRAMLEDWESDANLLEKERDAARAELAASDQALRESRANDLTTMATLADVRAELAALKAQQVGQEHYPECDYCGVASDHHPWHGSGLLNGEESRHIHACDSCRHLLPAAQGQQVECQECERLRSDLFFAKSDLDLCRQSFRAERNELEQDRDEAQSVYKELSSMSERWIRERDHLRAELAALKAQQVGQVPRQCAEALNRLLDDIRDVRNADDVAFGWYEAVEFYTAPQPAPAQDVADVRKMARALSDRQADACNVDREDQWKLYSEDFVADVEAMLAVAHDKQSGGGV